MGGCWVLTDRNNNFKIEKTLCHKEWGHNSAGTAEVLVLLELIEVLEAKGRQITEGEISIGFDCRKVCKKIVQDIRRTNDHAQESGAEISRIKELIHKIKFDVKIKLVTDQNTQPNHGDGFNLKKLLKDCDKKARVAREQIERYEGTTNVKCYGNYAMMHEGVIMSRSIHEMVRIIDSKKSEQRHGKDKLGCEHDFVDQEARNVFKMKDATPSMLKCTHGFNHYGLRDSMFNDYMVECYCPRCECVETWEHVVKCPEIIKMREEFMKKMLLEMLEKRNIVPVDTIMEFCEDMLRYLENDTEDECETNQHYGRIVSWMCDKRLEKCRCEL